LLDTLHAVPPRVALGLLIHRLVYDPLATPFIVPVPRDVPYYHETVAEPMDLGTVQARLAAEHYTQPATGTAAVSLQAGPGVATAGSGQLKLKGDEEEVVVDIDGEVAPAWVMEARAHVGKILGAAPDLTALSTKQVRAQVQEAMPSVDLRKDKGNRALLKAMIKEQAAAAQEATASTAAASPPALWGAEAFAHDVRLVWGNCRQFNETGSALFNSATALSKVFEHMWEAFRRPPPSAAERAAAAKAEKVAAAAEQKRVEKSTKDKAAKVKTTKAEKGKAGGGKAGVLPMSATAAAAPAMSEHQRELEAQGRWLVGRRLKVLFEDLRWHYGEVAAYEPHAMRLALRPYRIVWADNGGGSGGGGSFGSSGGIWHSIHVKSMDGKGHLDDSMLLELCEPPPESFVPSLISPAQEAAMAEEAKVARAEKERGEAIAAHRAKLGRDSGVETRINIAKGGRNNAASKGGSVVASTTGDSSEPDGEKWNAHVPAPPPVSTEARADDGAFRSGCAELFGGAADSAVDSPRTAVVTAALADTGAPIAPVFGASLGMPLMPLTPSAASLLSLDSPLVAASAKNGQCSAASLASVSASAPVAMTAENIVEGLGCGASPLNDKGDASMPLLNGALGDVFAAVDAPQQQGVDGGNGLPAATAGGGTPPPAPSAMERPTLSVPIGGCAAALENDGGGGGGGSGGSGGGAESGAKKKKRVSREMMGLQDFNSSGKYDPFPSAVTPRSCAPLQTAPLVAAPLSSSPLTSPSSSSNTEVARGQSSAACDEQPAKRAKSSSAAGCGLSSPLSNSNGVVQQVAADQSARTALPTKTVLPVKLSPSQPPTTPMTWHGTLSFKKAACQLTLHGSSGAPPRTAQGFTVIGRVALSHLNFETLVVLTLENRTACTDMIQKLATSLVDKERAAACQMHGSAEQPQGPSLYLCPLSLLRALDDKGTGMPPHLRQIVRAAPHQNDLVIGLWDAQRKPTPKKAVCQQKS